MFYSVSKQFIIFRSCTSPDFGVSGVLDRFQQINPKIIFSVDAVSYNMKMHDHLGKLRQVANGIGDALIKTIVIGGSNKQNVELQDNEIWLDDFLDEMSDPDAPLVFQQVVLYIFLWFEGYLCILRVIITKTNCCLNMVKRIISA